MKTEPLYFSSIDETNCYPLEYHLHDARIEELTEITLVEAIPDNDDSDHIWCTYMGEATERHMCKKAECSYYSSKSGRGKCEHRGNLYLHGEEVNFKVEPNQ